MPHLVWTLWLSILVAAVTALPGNASVRERVYRGVYTFGCCLVAVVAGSWTMYWIHG
jgi:hypothetical protein